MADIAAANAIRQRHGDAFGGEQGLLGRVQAEGVLIDLLAPFVGMLPDGYF